MAEGKYGACVEAHEAAVYDRGGKRRINPLINLGAVKWGRVTSDGALFTVTISGNRACKANLEVLDQIDADRHELVIWRDGARVAEGPILQVSWFSDRVVIYAKDVTQYLSGTSLSVDWPGPDFGGEPLMTDRIAGIIAYELTTAYDMRIGTGGGASLVTIPRWEALADPNPLGGPPIARPANVLPHLDVRPSSTLMTTASTLAFGMTLFEHLRNLAESGLDFTTVGRSILIYDSNYSIGQTRRLTDADFRGEIEVIQSGADYSAISHVSASRPEDATVIPSPGVTPGVGHAGGVDPYYGVWEHIASTESEQGESAPTEDALNSQAQRVQRSRGKMPIEIRVPSSSGLRLSHDLTLEMLIPGVIMPVAATFNLKQVTQDQRLTSMQVEETPTSEVVQVSLSPAGPITGLA